MIRPFSPLTAMPSSSSAPSPKPKRNPNPNSNSPNPNSGSLPPCKHSPAATLDLLILLLVLFSCAFLIISSLAHLVRTLSTVLPPLLRPLAASFHDAPLPYLAAIIVLLLIGATVAAAELSGAARPWDWPFWPRRRCGNPRCRGLRKALEFDVQLQTEDALRSPPDAAAASMWKEIDGLPWKGGQQGNNPDYECLRAELRRMAPPNGRAVLLFRSRCGCPVAKLEGWGPKRSRRQKKGCTGPFFVLKLQNLLIFVATHCLVQRLPRDSCIIENMQVFCFSCGFCNVGCTF